MSEQSTDWDDLRLALALGRAGSLAGAARALGVSHPTVFRRINLIEARFGARLFERGPGPYRPTTAGERVLAAAERVEAEVLALHRDVTGRDARLSGRLRITASETIAYRILNQLLADFRRAHEGIELELRIDNRQLDLSRREADVAIRATRPREADLHGRKVADVAWTLYSSPAYAEARGPLDTADLAHHAFIGWDEGAGVSAAAWLAEKVPAAAVVYRSSSLINHLMAVKAGIGLALLPCYLGDTEPEIRRATPPIATLNRELWLITHKDLRNTGRVRAFLDMIGAGLVSRRALFEGREPVPAR